MTNKTVRPIMTVEARDVLDKIHENMKRDDRSKSIVDYFEMRKKLYKEKNKCRSEVSQWKLVAWSMTAACVALIATMMITGAQCESLL